MSYGEQGRRHKVGWDDLDALVVEEMEALGGRPRERRSESQARAAARGTDPRAPESGRELADVAEDDEESFIERTVDYLRERPDAEALLEAIRAALNDADAAPVDDADKAAGGGVPLAGSADSPQISPDAAP